MLTERRLIVITVKPAILANLQRVLNITAQATVDSTSLADVVSLFLQPVTVSSVSVTANPDSGSPRRYIYHTRYSEDAAVICRFLTALQ